MGLLEDLQNRSGNQCELCGATEDLKVYEVPPVSTGGLDGSVLACATCLSQIENPDTVDSNHWRCLNDSMWSEQDAVKVVAWRMLNRLKSEGWPQDLLDMMYLDDEVLAWAKATGEGQDAADMVVHRDSNGVVLENGDNVVLIKDLKVKGSSMVAKQGTAVRRISLDRENAKYIEGKVDGQQIVILTKYVKKL
ncbi:PhnA domain-containing protein [Flagellimonas aequoris]|uniref:PhnA protein n=1 Tax=Flagellimonas aequoris TaxID=2306997 RepID=A0A418NAV8_9FLAO|nr:alkylphosphonate utilization protein [Allomuricauda aequoris]RIV73694.1 PhnA protein [Allomuricauda aequoris]TXK07377.1 PhnA protein [Allomuricauda aequoris]